MTERAARRCDVLVIGGGIAGASLASEIAPFRRVILLEREDRLAYHSTGRSAALFSQAYGPEPVRALSAASRDFLFRPPMGFADGPLMRPRGHLVFGLRGQEAALDAMAEDFRRHADGIERLSADDTICRVPALNPRQVGGGVFEPGAADIAVQRLHRGYLRLFRAFDGELICGGRVKSLTPEGAGWLVETGAGRIAAAVVVNAAGAWADEIVDRAGGSPLGLTARRRTAITVELAAPINAVDWPMTGDLDETVYFKAEPGRLLVSPADQTPVPPSDVQAEDLDVTAAVLRLERLTAMRVKRVVSRWAGQRTFAPDGLPVIGWDCDRAGGRPGFFWFAGQGGYGIQIAPAAARLAGRLLLGQPVPVDLADLGLTRGSFSPARFAAVPAVAAAADG